MKLSDSSKFFLGIPMLCLAGSVFAGPPVNYNGWTTTAGVIDTSASCSAANVVSCSTEVEDDGFLIETIETADYTYMRFVVTDPGASGPISGLDFTAETFIPFAFAGNGISQGIASMQVMRDAAGGFESTAEVQRSMMRFTEPAMVLISDKINEPTPAEDMYTVKLSQTINDPANGYIDTFDYTAYTAFATAPNMNPDSDTIIGRTMEITQRVDLGPIADPTSKQQYFEQKRRMGINGNIVTKPFWMAANDYYFIEGAPLSTANNLTLGGTNVSWADGDEIVSTWLAQESLLSENSALTHQVIENRTTAAKAVETNMSVGMPVTPSAWETVNFGPAPTFP